MTEELTLAERMQRLDERDAKLLAQLPPYDHKYEGRHMEPHSVKEITMYEDGREGSLSTNESSGCTVPAELVPLLPEGKVFGLEIRQGSTITGWFIDGVWHLRKTDEELEEAHNKWLADAKARHRAFYEENKDLWAQWSRELPEWVDPQRQFLEPSEEWIDDFMGYGYALTAARLAPMYAALGSVILDKDIFEISGFESEEIKEFSKTYGTSGNQHSWALAVAKRHLRDISE